MTLTLPDVPAAAAWSEDELRLELACALFARGRVSSRTAAELAGCSYGELLDALQERHISRYTEEMLDEDLATLDQLFPAPVAR